MPDQRPPAPVISPAANADIAEVQQWSVDRFGHAAAQRYEELLIQAVYDVAENPNRPGAKEWPLLMVAGART